MSFKRLQRRLVRILAALVGLSILFCFGLYAYRSIFGYQYDSSLFGSDLAAGVQADESITNLALFGLDTRPGETQSRSDCMMIASIDNTRGKIKLISLMRDSLVSIDGHGRDKLNAAYFLGGPALAIRTINQNFGTDITDYVAVNFEQMAQIVDELDGVEIDVQDFELDELNRVIRDYGIEQNQIFDPVTESGPQTLSGVQALCYGRIRKGGTGDDWGRLERQGVVLQAIFAKAQSSSASKLLRLMQKLSPYVTTSLSIDKMAPLVVGAVKNGMPALEHTRVPLDGDWQYAGSSGEYISYELDAAAEHIRAYIYDDVFPGDASSHAPGDTGREDGDLPDGPLDGMDFDVPPTAPAGLDEPDEPDSTADPASLAEEGGSYDPETGDYRDSDGDYSRLDENVNRVYYDLEAYLGGLNG